MSEISRDVIIVGGGLIGLTTAHALATSGITSHVIDSQDITATVDPLYDGRASAIASASVKMLKLIGLWERLAQSAQPIWEIRVTDSDSPQFIHFDAAHSNESGPNESGPNESGPLGYMMENRQLRAALQGKARESDAITLHAPVHITGLCQSETHASVTLANGTVLKAPLLIAADGRKSWVRDQVGIRTSHWGYGQAAIITTVSHREPHGDIAHERFLPDGPFAILPMLDDAEGRHRSAIVLTVSEATGHAMMALPDRPFQAEIASRFGDFLGPVAVISKRWSWPLGALAAEKLTTGRVVLVGDSAHGIHPIAGQGLNLGFRDVAALAEVLTEGLRLGLDLGDQVLQKRYERWRRPDMMLLLGVTDGLNRLFSNNLAGLARLRQHGMGAVNRLPKLKKFFMNQARGEGERQPKLLRGLNL